ncbi:MAG: SAM-dependent methyltransferase [Lachnospiraceae bacterium]|nr:SAM-dependent methyltransferase [Lachnospiraceae bacterium]
MREGIVLSNRLRAVVSMVTPGNRVCDIGCDHGFVPIYLVQQGISPCALAMDVRKGPLSQAGIHIEACGLKDLIETRLSDGLKGFRTGEADTLICAGMGGRLMMRILSEEAEKTASFRELILQPQSEIQQFRAFLREQGYRIAEENMIEEDGKFYPMMKAVCAGNKAGKAETVRRPAENQKTLPYGDSCSGYDDCDGFRQRMEDRYGPLLLEKRHPVLYRYLEREARLCDQIMEQMRTQGKGGDKSGRYEEIYRQKQNCLRVMKERYGDGYGENYD